MVLIDFQGWAKTDGQAGQHICPLHEQERLAIDFLGETETAGSEHTPLRSKSGRSPGWGTHLLLESCCLLREAGLREILYHIHHRPFHRVSRLLFAPRTVLEQREAIRCDAPLDVTHPGPPPLCLKHPNLRTAKGGPICPRQGWFSWGQRHRGWGVWPSGSRGWERKSICLWLCLGLSSTPLGILTHPEGSLPDPPSLFMAAMENTWRVPLPGAGPRPSSWPWWGPHGVHSLTLSLAL